MFVRFELTHSSFADCGLTQLGDDIEQKTVGKDGLESLQLRRINRSTGGRLCH